ncbi:DUF2066 domain-containing protein [Parvularcula sp. ZS-1/3]|uniref:DUF2066 domain-containing protein n=1 Tax=Parvularcula mediterranea TaxID=2732508 RepID=A0A7Y3RLL2_9PROT|nr:DUF2066 domain-containing protein [Parvularcula mediterranea]NNU16348.1 DUF2066 domain-containing protein [Parvularcula mediterranea]
MLRFFALFSVVLSLLPAFAQDVFTVAEVPVAAQAKSAAEAQEQARDLGRRQALDLLLRRLVSEEDWIYLPNLAEELEAEAVTTPRAETYDIYDPNSVEAQLPTKQPLSLTEQQIRSFEMETNVFNEKSSGTTYRAQITYRFKPDAIRNILRGARLPYSEEQARRVLILPVLRTANDTYLWEAKNPWARAWLARPLVNELTPMELPQGDVIDTQAITADEAANLNGAALRAFAERYTASKIYLAKGDLQEVNGEFRLRVRLIDATPPSLNASGPQTSAIGTEVVDLFFRGKDDDFPALARRAVESTVARHSASWKRRTLVDYSQQRTFDLTAWFNTQAAWSHIQDAINDSALVQDAETQAFSNANAIMMLTVVGAEEQFSLAMRERDLTVWQDRSERWHIAETDLASVLMTRTEPLTTDIDEEVERRRGLGRFFGRRGNRDDRADEPEAEDTSEAEIPELPDDLFGDDGGR